MLTLIQSRLVRQIALRRYERVSVQNRRFRFSRDRLT